MNGLIHVTRRLREEYTSICVVVLARVRVAARTLMSLPQFPPLNLDFLDSSASNSPEKKIELKKVGVILRKLAMFPSSDVLYIIGSAHVWMNKKVQCHEQI